jgi:predicted RNA methylase
MSATQLEQRVAQLEQDVLQLKQAVNAPLNPPWWERIAGAFADTPALDRAVEHGRHYRHSQRAADDEDGDVPA